MTYEEIKNQLKSQSGLRHFNRELSVDSTSIDAEKMYCEFSVSSETPVMRWFGYEILDHSISSIRMGRLNDGAAHRDGHYGDQIGIVEKAWIDETQRKLRVGVRFSKNTARALEVFKDISDGIRKNVSIDYNIHELVLEKEVENESYYRIMDWEPIHTCNTPDGADPSVGMGRSKDYETTVLPFNADSDNLSESIEKFNRENSGKIKILFNQNRSTKPMTEEEKKLQEEAQKAAIAEARRDAGERETLRVKGIRMMANDLQRNMPGVKLEEEAEKFIQTDKSEMDFYNFCREKMRDPEATRTPEAHLDLTENEKKRFSLSRALLAMADGTVDKLGIEKEVSDTLVKKLNRSTKGLLVPTNLMGGNRAAQQNVSSAAAGGNTVFEMPTTMSFIEYLTNALIALQAGVQFMPGMSGDVPFIRELDEMGYYWIGESGTVTGSGITYSRVKATPKHLGAKTSISRQMLLQSNNVSEAYVARKLYGAIKKGIDRGIFYGTGANNQPFGVKNITGVPGTLGADFDRAKAISMKSAVRSDNAEIGGVSWLANPLTAGVLQGKPIAANYPAFLLNDENVMIARKLFESNQIDEGDLFYGVMSSIYLLEWGYIDVSSNPYAEGWDAGDIQVRALHAVDVFAEYPQALNVAEGVN